MLGISSVTAAGVRAIAQEQMPMATINWETMRRVFGANFGFVTG
jgi:hypothetical protein